MLIFLAGGESRHWLNEPLIEENKMQIYLAGVATGGSWNRESRIKHVTGEDMNVFLAGTAPWRNEGLYDKPIKQHKPYILESFYYVDADTERLLPYFGDFLLDSGAFTFMSSSKNHVVWEEYIERYAAFINKNNIKKFFELDIDSVVGYKKVLEYREKLERLTNKQVIPVWHKSRGTDEFKKMCDEYSYVSIGGIVSKEIPKEQYPALPVLISEAHKRKAKIHGLGFTSLEWLPKCHFDSVDSTAWTTGNRFGFVYRFDGKTMVKYDCPKGKRLGDSRKVAEINYLEWIKFQKYAEANL